MHTRYSHRYYKTTNIRDSLDSDDDDFSEMIGKMDSDFQRRVKEMMNDPFFKDNNMSHTRFHSKINHENKIPKSQTTTLRNHHYYTSTTRNGRTHITKDDYDATTGQRVIIDEYKTDDKIVKKKKIIDKKGHVYETQKTKYLRPIEYRYE